MKSKPQRPLTRPLAGAAVPQFIALLGVLREAAARGLALLPDPPAPPLFPRPGKTGPGFSKPWKNTRLHEAPPCTST